MMMSPVFPLFFIGFSVAWYALRGQQLLGRTAPSRLQRLLGFIFVWWALSTFKDLLLYLPSLNTEAMQRHVFFIDGCGAVTFALLLFELTMSGWVTRWRAVGLMVPFAVFFVLHFFIGQAWFDWVFTVFFVAFA